MSVINKVLRELDQRHAIADSPDQAAPRDVRPVRDASGRHEWFWRIVAALLLVALVWVGWVVFQTQPIRVATDVGIAAGETSRRAASRPAERAAPPPSPEPVASTRAVVIAEPSGVLRLAESIETPILQQGRVSEAEGRFAAAIGLDPAHEQARQVLAAMLIEQRRLEEARRLLQEGLRINPKQQQFAVALARIHMERADYAGALEVLNRGRNDAQPSAEYDAVLGSVLSRLGRDREAVEAYRAALRIAPDKGGTWLGLALSLESLERRAEATDAYRRALASGTLTADVRQYAEQKIRALR